MGKKKAEGGGNTRIMSGFIEEYIITAYTFVF